MNRIVVAMERDLLVVRQEGDHATLDRRIEGIHPRCLAGDPERCERLYCGTAGNGLLCSDDGGESWQQAGEAVSSAVITALATAGQAIIGQYATVYAGTDPTGLFRSDDGGTGWEALNGLLDLPSAPTWSFPPRPDTHHVRAIAVSPHDAHQIYVCVEAGALVRSLDRGRAWEDRKPGSPYDTHTLVMHRHAPGRLYAAAGDGYFESRDCGTSWQRQMDGLRYRYLWSVAVDPADPDMVVISAALGPYQAHNAAAAQSTIYRRHGNEQWSEVRSGLPVSGATVASLAVSEREPGIFYLANNHGLYRSTDEGQHWQQLELAWPDDYRHQRVQSLVVSGD